MEISMFSVSFVTDPNASIIAKMRAISAAEIIYSANFVVEHAKGTTRIVVALSIPS